jgi:glutamate dehydrogenase
VARAFAIIRDSFDLRTLWADIEALDNKLPASVQTEMMLAVGALLERAMRWLLRSGYETLDIAAYVAEFEPRISAIQQRLDVILPAPLLAGLRVREAELVEDGIPAALAHRVASLDVMSSALDIVRIAQRDANRAVEDVARVYFGLGARFELDRLRSGAAAINTETPWQKAAVTALVDDLFTFQSLIASRVIGEANGTGDPVDSWLTTRNRTVVDRVDQTMTDVKSAPAVDLAMLTVASRQLRTLLES